MTTLLEPPTGTIPAVLGLDLSLTATGVCLPDGSTHTIKTNTKHGDRRLLHIGQAIANALAPGADLAVVEDLPTHAHSAGITGMVHGVVRAALLEAGVPYVLVAPATLKKYATGAGNGDKTAMAIAALKRAGAEFADDNQCDAFWLRAAGLDRLGHPLFPLPQAQRDALDKVTWPQLAVAR
jgi:Holliday junction resolvasome RuvABC endonuclease subunit